jgi:hypothetical protein
LLGARNASVLHQPTTEADYSNIMSFKVAWRNKEDDTAEIMQQVRAIPQWVAKKQKTKEKVRKATKPVAESHRPFSMLFASLFFSKQPLNHETALTFTPVVQVSSQYTQYRVERKVFL